MKTGKCTLKAIIPLIVVVAMIAGFAGTAVAEEVDITSDFSDVYGETLDAQYDYDSYSLGSQGDTVAYIQQMLNNLGYSTVVDGDFGVYTMIAVMKFQREYGLYEDGIVASLTMAALEAASGGAAVPAPAPAPEPEPTPEPTPAPVPEESADIPSSLSIGSTGGGVVKLQRKLTELGFYYGEIDGSYGQHTAGAVSRYQSANGLYADGYAGPITLAKLFGGQSSSSQSQQQPQSQPQSSEGLSTSSYLVRGDHGEQLRLLQIRLQELGYLDQYALIDGDFGALTEQAVRTFQKDKDLYVDGEAGPLTIKALLTTVERYDPNTSHNKAVQMARAKLDQVGWDLKKAFNWTASLEHVGWDAGSTISEGARYAFTNGVADCIGKASAFCLMARELGFNCVVKWGAVLQVDGSYAAHAWNEIVVDGKTYVCDPNYQWGTGRNGYMINYGQSGTWKYRIDGNFPE